MADTLLSTLDKLIASIRVLLNETGTTSGFWVDTEITDEIQEAQEEIANETFCLRTWKTYIILGLVGETNDIFDERELRMDDDFIAIDEGVVYYNDVALRPTTQARLVLGDSKWRSETGTPSRYYVRGDMLGFDCKISAGATVKFYQIERAAPLASVTTEGHSLVPFNGDYRLINFRKLIRDYVVSMCWEKKGESNRSDKFWQKYQIGLQRMKELLNIDMDDTYNIIVDSHPAHFGRRKRFPDW